MFECNSSVKLLLALFLMILGFGCATEHVISAKYKPNKDRTSFDFEKNGLTLFLLPAPETVGTLWYRAEGHSWYLSDDPKAIVHEALVQELETMGIRNTEDPREAQGRLEFQIRWFGPYGHSPFSAAVILSMALYSVDDRVPLWRGKIEAGESVPQPAWFVGGNTHPIEQVLLRVLSNAMRQLRWKPGFQQGLKILAEKRIDQGTPLGSPPINRGAGVAE
jgi:hypothetical protein